MLEKLSSLLTTRCPICRYRYGMRAQRLSRDRLLSMFFVYPFECRSCNSRFHSFWFS